MSVGRDPVDRVIDVAIATPLCTAVAAREALPLIARAGGRTAMSALARVLRTPSEPVPSRQDPSVVDQHPPECARHEGAPTPATVPTIAGYDELTAQQVCDRLPELSADELETTRLHELAHRRRRTVLGKIEQLMS